MAIASMTGFGRAEDTSSAWTWNWEARSVNGRGLDVRCRLPQGAEELEAEVRSGAAKLFSRGNITINLSVTAQGGASQYRINHEFLSQLVETAKALNAEDSATLHVSSESLLGVRGVVEAVENERESILAGDARERVLKAAEDAFQGLRQARLDEGARIAIALEDQIASMERLCATAIECAAVRPEKYKEKFLAQLAELLEGAPPVPDERIAQEVAVMATKLDVREELDRLHVHLESARSLLDEGGVVGRKLDFLCQEINREANTICSKSADVELTQIGLELKTTLDQFREQVQNVE